MRTLKWLVLALTALSIPSVASAQLQLQMTGEWFSNRGPLVDIPLNGGPQLIPAATCDTIPGCVRNAGAPVGFQPANGGIPIRTGTQETVDVGFNLGGPASIVIPAGAFGQNTGMAYSTAQVPNVQTVVQLETNFQVFAPATDVGPTTGTSMAFSPDRVLRANAWTNQTGRLSPNFSWCPGAVTGMGTTIVKVGFVTNCQETIASQRTSTTGMGGQGFNGRVTYNAGPNAFGGTMAILLDGGGRVYVTIGSITIPTTMGMATTMTPLLASQPIGEAGAMGLRSQVEGGGYALLNSAYLQSGNIFVGFQTNGTEITFFGPPLTSMGYTAMLPQDRNLNWGFPHTTGTVSFRDIEQSAQGGNASTTFTAMGTDQRDAFGRGNIVLVSGGISYRVGAQQSFQALNLLDMTFTPEPGPSLMLGASLLVVGGAFAVVRRRGRASR